MKKLSYTEENYLKAIYFIGRPGEKMVSTNAIAERLKTKAATVTDMLRKLGDKKLIDYKPYKGSKLTAEGLQAATAVLRKHRLWETFLVDKLDFGWEEVHAIAEQLEHIQSAKLTNRLAAFLGHPEYDPHGDPIPNEQGVFPKREQLTLDQVEAGQWVIIKGVKDTSTDFLKYIRKMGIELGDEMQVVSVESFDKSMILNFSNQKLNLSSMAASNIYVTQL